MKLGLLAALAAVGAVAAAMPTDELIQSLPSLQDTLNFQQYSGYTNVDDNKQLYYWYVESQNDPVNDPVILWLNGGPGCSSLEGLLMELGPYRAADYGATLHLNPYSWNKFANIIFMDAPAGVGFSYSKTGNLTYTDDQVAADNHQALINWFAKFTERKSNDFYVAGESYGGTYVPMLAALLVKDTTNFPQFKGMFVGNGCLNDQLQTNSIVGYNYNHGFIDETYYKNVTDTCCNGSHDCDYYSMISSPKDSLCKNMSTDLSMANFYSGLDPYFIYFTCYLDPQPQGAPKTQKEIFTRHYLRTLGLENEVVFDSVPACAHYNDSTSYLMRDDVRKALMIPDYVQAYTSCSDKVEQLYVSQYPDKSQFVKQVVDGKKKVMFFNGDIDSVCNVMHNEQFVQQLGYPVVQPKQSWNDQEQLPPTCGYVTKYQGVDMVTIRGAGHFASSSSEKPKESLQMFYNFIKGTSYDNPVPALPNQVTTEAGGSTTTTTVAPTTTLANAVSIFTAIVAAVFSL